MPGSATVTINDKQWAVDIAISESELAAGLGGLSSIPAGTGMLFDLQAPQVVEVTTEPMLFNIDIIFISEGLEVVDVIEDVAPGYLVTEDTPVRYFLEVNAGEAEGIEAGDSVTITDYQYTPPSIISQWMPTIIGISMIGFIGAMVGRMVSSMFSSSSPREELPAGARGERLMPETQSKPTREDVTVDSWVERDRIGIWVTNVNTGETVAEWWNEEAREMFEDGFFEEADYIRGQKLVGRKFEESVKDYLEGVDILASGSMEYLPQTKPTELNGLRITKAYKQVSRHGKDEISVSLQAWGVFPRGRRPHIISMYRSGDKYVINPLYGHTTHWVDVPVSEVKAWIRSLPIRHFEPMAVAPEYREKAEELAKGVDEPIEILSLAGSRGEGQPAVIPTEPRWRRESELEYFADSPEYLTQTIDNTGYRSKLDTTFKEAVARAKGLK